MINLICADGVSQWFLPVILLVMVVGLFVFNYVRQKKFVDQSKKLVSELKVGSLVKTYSGIYGTIIEITETNEGKIAVLKTGGEDTVGFFSIDINAIYGIVPKIEIVEEELTETETVVEDILPLQEEVEISKEVAAVKNVENVATSDVKTKSVKKNTTTKK